MLDWPTPIPGIINAHEVTHVLDMIGTAFHVVFMLRYIVPYQPAIAVQAASDGAVPALANV